MPPCALAQWAQTWDYICGTTAIHVPDSKGHGANMGPITGRKAPGWPHELYNLGWYLWTTDFLKYDAHFGCSILSTKLDIVLHKCIAPDCFANKFIMITTAIW